MTEWVPSRGKNQRTLDRSIEINQTEPWRYSRSERNNWATSSSAHLTKQYQNNIHVIVILGNGKERELSITESTLQIQKFRETQVG